MSAANCRISSMTCRRSPSFIRNGLRGDGRVSVYSKESRSAKVSWLLHVAPAQFGDVKMAVRSGRSLGTAGRRQNSSACGGNLGMRVSE
jgi:hypothetical protein